ncbi:MAG TPA: Ig-like domain-containing protein [Patescibacteria group bacterium]|nr:Ig-like domain-containing protein [Patescibacteria group bacterium]
MSYKRFGLILSALLLVGLFAILTPSKATSAPRKLREIPLRHFRRACDNPKNGEAACHIQVVTDSAGKPLASGTPSGGFGPDQIHNGYNLPCTPGGPVQSVCATPSLFGPQVIGIVDAYNAPTIENDLNMYSENYGLPLCTRANGCLSIVNQNGGSSLPPSNSSWALETSLDVEVAHMMCQTCKILLVEANSASITDLGTAVNRAATLGATSISNSYGATEWSSESAYDPYYNHPGIAVIASTGDDGYGASYPAANPQVIAVGGTTLSLFQDNNYSSENVWSGTGSGCSSYENASSFQTNIQNWSLTGCSSKRGIADLSADADPNTGVSVYDSTSYQGSRGWWIVGGTSLASPIVAGTFALSGNTYQNPASYLYANYNLANFRDITNGSNGTCKTIMCHAGNGYDGPTGLGSLNGLSIFGTNSGITPTPSATPTPTLSQTPTPSPTPTLTPTPPSGDTISPTVSITSPQNNSTVRHSTSQIIRANAVDNVKVTKVEFYVNGSLLSTDNSSPYVSIWNVPSTRNKTYSLSAKAYDPSGNIGVSQTITVTSQ